MNAIENRFYFFLQNNQIKKDFDISTFSISRYLKSQLYNRSYDIKNILKHTVLESNEQLSQIDIDVLSKKSSKNLKINADLIKTFIQASRLFSSNRSSSIDMLRLHFCKFGSHQLKKFKNIALEYGLSKTDEFLDAIDFSYYKAKWLELGLDGFLADKCPEDVAFLVKTRLIYSIVGLQNSSKNGKKEHEIKTIGNVNDTVKHLMIKKERVWVKVSSLIKSLSFDEKEMKLTTKHNPSESWNYFSDGLLPVDRFHHHQKASQIDYPSQNKQLHCIAKLSKTEMEDVLERALPPKSRSLQSEDFDACIQFISHPRPYFKSPLLKNLNSQIPVHCGIRIITNDGSIYSTGFGSTTDEDRYNSGTWNFLGSINGQPTNIDYEEFRVHSGRITTSIKVTEKDAQNILRRLNYYRKHSIRFHMLKQNCMKLGTHVLALLGENVDIKISLGTMLYRSLPDLKDIPLIGNQISTSYRFTKNCIDSIALQIPQIVKNIFTTLGELLFYIPQKIITLFENVLVYTLGGNIGSPEIMPPSIEDDDMPDEESDLLFEQEDNLEDFFCLLSNIFDDEAASINHSSVFINWQLLHPSTEIHPYLNRPSMNVTPLKEKKIIQEAEEKLEFLKDIYKHSTPITSILSL